MSQRVTLGSLKTVASAQAKLICTGSTLLTNPQIHLYKRDSAAVASL